MNFVAALVAACAASIACLLQGCGGGGTPTPTPPGPPPPPGPPTPPPPSPTPGWKTNPIEVRGQHLYDSVTGKSFHGIGIGFPNLPKNATADDWVATLKRIKTLSPHINLVRLYEPPCSQVLDPTAEDCIEQFMAAADNLGIYVLVPGTGTIWGYLPGPQACKPMTADGCYKTGGVLGWGQSIVRLFNYPNTLAIVIGNEFDQQQPVFIPVIKAYARDMKSHMSMCNTNDDSPTKGKMRQIPLAYANSDDRGDKLDKAKADYLFCGKASESIDMFGLNIERWCNYKGGRAQYSAVDKWVGEAAYPGAFMFTEMGCYKRPYAGDARDWAQLPRFFENYTAIDGFIGYTYFGNSDFDMFDAPWPNANILQDGKNFFNQTEHIGALPERQSVEPQRPECATTILGDDLDSVDSVQWYDTGKAGQAPQCPQPPKPHLPVEVDGHTQQLSIQV